MFCDQCGTQLEAGQAHCTRCGKPVVGPQTVRSNRVQEHVRLLGVLWIAYSVLHVLGAAFAFFIARTFLGGGLHINNGPPPEFFHFVRPIVTFVAWLILIKAVAGVVAGWGLLQREDWARVLTLVVGFLALLSVPIGTALGVYTLWVLLPAESERDYKTLSAAA